MGEKLTVDVFEVELAALIDRFGQKLSDNQIITVLERALDESLVIAGDMEATNTAQAFAQTAIDFLPVLRAYVELMINLAKAETLTEPSHGK